MIRAMEGFDVHGDKGRIDWAKARADGHSFAFVKASEGATFVDARIAENLSGGAKAGLLVGPYHYARPDNRPNLYGAKIEANFFCKVIAAAGYNKVIHGRPVLDIEVGGGDLSAWANAFCSWVEELTGVSPIIYSYTYFVRSHLQAPYLADRLLWLANYGPNDGSRHEIPSGEAPWPNWTVHQYTSRGSVSGVSGNADRNFTDSLSPLRAFESEGKPMWLWIRWKRGHGEFKPFGKSNPAVRPDVPKKIPAAWWARLLLNMGIHPLGGGAWKRTVQ